jgi:hypothetical protein
LNNPSFFILLGNAAFKEIMEFAMEKSLRRHDCADGSHLLVCRPVLCGLLQNLLRVSQKIQVPDPGSSEGPNQDSSTCLSFLSCFILNFQLIINNHMHTCNPSYMGGRINSLHLNFSCCPNNILWSEYFIQDSMKNTQCI